MLRATVEYVPHGDESRARAICRMVIVNDGTGDRATGNYRATVATLDEATGKWRRTTRRLTGWPRLERTALDLVGALASGKNKEGRGVAS